MEVMDNVIKDKEELITKADKVSNELLLTMKKISSDVDEEHDPRQIIYFLIHVISQLCSKTAISIQGFGEIYGIQGLTISAVKSWMDSNFSTYIAMFDTNGHEPQ